MPFISFFKLNKFYGKKFNQDAKKSKYFQFPFPIVPSLF